MVTLKNFRTKKIYIVAMFLLIVLSIIVSVSDKVSSNLNYIILILFACDTLQDLWQSENKKQYMREHVLDFVALIPFYHGFRVIKFIPLTFQLIRITSVGQRYFLPVINKLRETGTGRLFNVFLLIFIFLPLPLIWLEPNLHTYSDLLWWEMQTVTTVGYGDIAIETSVGRAIGMVLMILGVGIITTFTSSITRALSKPTSTEEEKKSEKLAKLVATKNFSNEELDLIEAWVKLEKQRRAKNNDSK